jgi:hypothetical protein
MLDCVLDYRRADSVVRNVEVDGSSSWDIAEGVPTD